MQFNNLSGRQSDECLTFYAEPLDVLGRIVNADDSGALEDASQRAERVVEILRVQSGSFCLATE